MDRFCQIAGITATLPANWTLLGELVARWRVRIMLRRLMLTAYAGLRHDTELAAEMRANGYNAETCTIAEPYLSRFS
jgi:hypothetical protein